MQKNSVITAFIPVLRKAKLQSNMEKLQAKTTNMPYVHEQSPLEREISSMAISPAMFTPLTPSNTTCHEIILYTHGVLTDNSSMKV